MGGPGSGPQTGGSKTVSVSLSKNKTKLTIQQADAELKKRGYELGRPTFDLQSQTTSYAVRKGGKTTMMTTKQIKTLLYSK